MFLQNFGDGRDVCGGKKHAGFDRGDFEGFEHQRNLVGDDFNGDGADGADEIRRFRNDAGDRREAVDAVVLEGFEVGLDSRAGRTIGAGDGHGDRWERFHGGLIACDGPVANRFVLGSPAIWPDDPANVRRDP